MANVAYGMKYAIIPAFKISISVFTIEAVFFKKYF